ncbi:hypothetical protein SAMN02949497_0166 [Methylomagnum ishizawai]|uniref:Uncharacterized protein n=1 Tax=Methylomagnum ishizawai TaxID=1760988 RepID=A0A1Y6D4S8_9GAMM|nr:hypothetical protein [Methylomagnum ishizawai]SMF97596.1 hypothetical protein SAMN02949497_0166 [Methylomagnum ishizawai]
MSTFIKTTADGRKVEVIGTYVCLDGKPEADRLVPVLEHPNVRAIITAVPEATHMAGRLALSADEAASVQTALTQGKTVVDPNPQAIAERIRNAQRAALVARD